MSALTRTPSRAFVLGLVVALGAIGAALVSQHVFDMQPCPWCVLQRLLFALIAVVCVLGLAWRGRPGTVVAATLGLLLSLAGAAAALWQHFVAAASDSCNLTLADRIVSGLQLDALAPEVFQARATCAEAAVRLAGIPYDVYSLVLFVALGALLFAPLLRRR
jgi:disulfide bond formation protein DsbB